jgi:hypothetical protein
MMLITARSALACCEPLVVAQQLHLPRACDDLAGLH